MESEESIIKKLEEAKKKIMYLPYNEQVNRLRDIVITEETMKIALQRAMYIFFKNSNEPRDSLVRPCIYLPVGAPASGKSEVVSYDLKRLKGQAVVIDMDEARMLIPGADWIIKNMPNLYIDITHPIVGKRKEFIDMAVEWGYNAIIESTNGKETLETLSKTKKKVDIILQPLITSRLECGISAMERHVLLMEKTGVGRFNTAQQIDVRYNLMIDVISGQASKMKLPIEIYQRPVEGRTPELIFAANDCKNFKKILQVIEDARMESLSRVINNPTKTKERLQRIKAIIEEFAPEEFNKLLELYNRCLHEGIEFERINYEYYLDGESRI